MSAPFAENQVLVVDDELEMRIFIANLLRANGFGAIGSGDGRQALQQARRWRPALIILNAMMAEGAGMQLYCRLKQDLHLKKIPVLMLSTIDRRTLFLACKMGGQVRELPLMEPEAYVLKPPEGEELLGLVHRLIRRRMERETETGEVDR